MVINEFLSRVRTGVPWHDLPERYGSLTGVRSAGKRGRAPVVPK
ncbi:hypothetical protein [Streptomyces sp. NBC_00443]